jgi:glutamate transport system permease protein
VRLLARLLAGSVLAGLVALVLVAAPAVASCAEPSADLLDGSDVAFSGVVAELVRSGVHSLPSGQSEAGLSIGLTPGQTLRSIQLPQALTAMLPALVGQLVVILKDSALGTAITYPELLQQGRDAGTAYAAVIPAYVVVALIFIVINYGLTVLAGQVERRINRRGRAAGGTITNAMPGAPGGSGAMPSTGLAGDNVQNLDPRGCRFLVRLPQPA